MKTRNNESSDKLVSIGEIIKPHGFKGHLKFFLYNEGSQILSVEKIAYLQNSSDKLELEIEDVNLISSTPIIKFFDINSKEEAEKYRKYKISLLCSVFERDNADDIYLFNFIGCTLYFEEELIGLIEDIVTFSGNDLLLVKNDKSKAHYVPINKKLIKLFDIEDRKLIMNKIEGLLDIC